MSRRIPCLPATCAPLSTSPRRAAPGGVPPRPGQRGRTGGLAWVLGAALLLPGCAPELDPWDDTGVEAIDKSVDAGVPPWFVALGLFALWTALEMAAEALYDLATTPEETAAAQSARDTLQRISDDPGMGCAAIIDLLEAEVQRLGAQVARGFSSQAAQDEAVGLIAHLNQSLSALKKACREGGDRSASRLSARGWSACAV